MVYWMFLVLNIDRADIYTSELLKLIEIEAHRGMIHIRYEDIKIRKVSRTPPFKKGTTYFGDHSGLKVACLDKGDREVYLKVMLDTGATLNVMSFGAWRRLGFERTDLRTTEIKIMTANDQPMK